MLILFEKSTVMARKKNIDEEYEGDGETFAFPDFDLSVGAKRTIAAILLVLLAIVFILGLFSAAGPMGDKLDDFVGRVFGYGKIIMPIILLIVALFLLRTKMSKGRTATKISAAVIMFVSILSLLHLIPYTVEEFSYRASLGQGGGYIGSFMASLMVGWFGKLAAGATFFFAGIIAAILAFNKSFVGWGDTVADKVTNATSLEGVKKGTEAARGGFFSRIFNRDKKSLQEDRELEEDFDDEQEYEDDEEIEEIPHDKKKASSPHAEEEYDLDEEGFDDDDTLEEEVWEDGEPEYEDEYEEEVASVKETASEKASRILGASATKQPRTERVDSTEPLEWELPPLRLLARGGKKAKGGDTKARAQVIQDTFADFGIDMELEDIVTGPTVTQFSFRPPSGVKLTKIKTLADDLALALAAHPIRIEAPIPGKSLVGIEVPNKEKAMVRIRDLINTDDFEDDSKPLLFALGEDVNGDHVIEDLAKMPHLLVAGATGAGKSVTVNSMLLSLLYKNSPDDLKMILIDPKRVELSLYNGIPHLLSEVITDNGKVLNALKWGVSEMERRYEILQKVGTRDLKSYKVKRESGQTMRAKNPETEQIEDMPLENLPIIVIVIDEMADLMASHGKEVEGVIVRLAQMSRAVGIHLIVSTQRPSVEVITGTIKANLPTRIALRVATGIDSRTIIDSPGAEKLVGHGDMLYVGTNSSSPRRLQGVFVDEEEVKKVIDFIKRQAAKTGAFDIEENFDSEGSTSDQVSAEAQAARGITSVNFDDVATTASGIGESSEDPMYEEAKAIVIAAGKASTSYIQRRLRVGYSRAARLIDELEDNGIIGPAEGSKPRTILSSGDEEGYGEEYEDDVERQEDREKWN